jgi:hypothetical protein
MIFINEGLKCDASFPHFQKFLGLRKLPGYKKMGFLAGGKA